MHRMRRVGKTQTTPVVYGQACARHSRRMEQRITPSQRGNASRFSLSGRLRGRWFAPAGPKPCGRCALTGPLPACPRGASVAAACCNLIRAPYLSSPSKGYAPMSRKPHLSSLRPHSPSTGAFLSDYVRVMRDEGRGGTLGNAYDILEATGAHCLLRRDEPQRRMKLEVARRKFRRASKPCSGTTASTCTRRSRAVHRRSVERAVDRSHGRAGMHGGTSWRAAGDEFAQVSVGALATALRATCG